MPTTSTPVQPCAPRADVQVTLPDGRTFCAPVGTPVAAFVTAAGPFPVPVVAALLDGRLCELTEPVEGDAALDVVPLDSGHGYRVYQSSLVLLLVAAARTLFPQTRLAVDHSVTYGGLFCHVLDGAQLDSAALAKLERKMRAWVRRDVPIERRTVTLAEASAWARAADDDVSLRLFQSNVQRPLRLYGLAGTEEWFEEMLVPSVGYLTQFDLQALPDGFVLRAPPMHDPTALADVRSAPKLTTIFREYSDWLQRMDILHVGALNEAVAGGMAREIVLVTEALHMQRIADIAAAIVGRNAAPRLILISGPSSSGKTTFSRNLSIQLMAKGLRPYAIGLDDYFVRRIDTPRDQAGNYDFEALEALDLPLFNEQLLQLMDGATVTLPRYNFQTGEREVGPAIRLGANQPLVVEGIHGLNPALVPHIPPERIFRIYVSALTQLRLNHLNRVPTSDARLLRRIVRDARERGYSATDTIRRWPRVRLGEIRHIFPFQEHANVMFNSALAYELAVLKPLAEPLLRQVEPDAPEYNEARRLLHFLDWFASCPADFVPEDSILREFTGGSVFEAPLSHFA